LTAVEAKHPYCGFLKIKEEERIRKKCIYGKEEKK